MRYVIAAFLVLAACSNTGLDSTIAPTIAVSPDFSPKEVAGILEGIGKWEAAAPQFHPNVSVGLEGAVIIRPGTSCNHEGWDPAHDAAYTWDEGAAATICLDIAQTAPYLANAAAHELGHALGLHHAAAPSIMRIDSDRLSPWTVQQGDVVRVEWR